MVPSTRLPEMRAIVRGQGARKKARMAPGWSSRRYPARSLLREIQAVPLAEV